MIQVMSSLALSGPRDYVFVQNAELAWITVPAHRLLFFSSGYCQAITKCIIFSKKKSAASMLIWTKPFQSESRYRSGMQEEVIKGLLSRMTAYVRQPLRQDFFGTSLPIMNRII